jgi:hypothetical protein
VTYYQDICLVVSIFSLGYLLYEISRFFGKMTHVLSKRAQQMLDKRDFLDHYTMLCMHDPFDQDTNKEVSSK